MVLRYKHSETKYGFCAPNVRTLGADEPKIVFEAIETGIGDSVLIEFVS